MSFARNLILIATLLLFSSVLASAQNWQFSSYSIKTGTSYTDATGNGTYALIGGASNGYSESETRNAAYTSTATAYATFQTTLTWIAMGSPIPIGVGSRASLSWTKTLGSYAYAKGSSGHGGAFSVDRNTSTDGNPGAWQGHTNFENYSTSGTILEIFASTSASSPTNLGMGKGVATVYFTF